MGVIKDQRAKFGTIIQMTIKGIVGKALVSKSRDKRIESLAEQKIFQFSEKSWNSGKYDNKYI